MEPKKINTIILPCPHCKVTSKNHYTQHRVKTVIDHGKKRQEVTCLLCGKSRLMF